MANLFEIATLGLIDDPTGSEAAGEAQTEAARLSAGAIIESTEAQIDFSKWLWEEQKEISQPFVDIGTGALPGLTEAIDKPFTAEEMMQDPGYQFRLEEGIKGIESSAAARGMQLSGRTLKGVGRYAQDYASGEFQQAYGRRQQGISNLMNLALMGQSAAAGQATAGQAMGGSVTAAMGEAGRAQAGMYSDIGNIQAAGAMSSWNTMMDIGGLAATTYGGKGWGA